MSPKKRNGTVRDSVRQAAVQLKPAAQRAVPVAKNTARAARRQLLRTRAWAAPQVERSGQVLQDTVAPKISAMLSSAAQRLDPAHAHRRRWQKPVGLATLTAAGGAAAAFIRNRRKPTSQTPPSGPAETVPSATMPNSQPKTSVGTNPD